MAGPPPSRQRLGHAEIKPTAMEAGSRRVTALQFYSRDDGDRLAARSANSRYCRAHDHRAHRVVGLSARGRGRRPSPWPASPGSRAGHAAAFCPAAGPRAPGRAGARACPRAAPLFFPALRSRRRGADATRRPPPRRGAAHRHRARGQHRRHGRGDGARLPTRRAREGRALMGPVERVWVYLSATPLLWLAATLLAYEMGSWVFRRAGGSPLANPVPIAVAILIALLAGSATAILSAVALARWLGASSETLKSMAPKSATTPIAMAISEQIGGLPSLTAAFVIATGIVGAVLVTPLLDALRIRDWRGRGFSAGVAAHGLGTARAFQVNELAGTFAGIGLALNGITTAVLVPILLGWLR